jgi:hypothetical protein
LQKRCQKFPRCLLSVVANLPRIELVSVYNAAGFYAGAARLMGLDKVRCEFVLEADRVLYRLDW